MSKSVTHTIQIKIDADYIDTSFVYNDAADSFVKVRAKELFESMGKRHKVRIIKTVKTICYEL